MWGRALALQDVEQAPEPSRGGTPVGCGRTGLSIPGTRPSRSTGLETGGYRLAERASGEDEVR
jgi:hypothetical protein